MFTHPLCYPDPGGHPLRFKGLDDAPWSPDYAADAVTWRQEGTPITERLLFKASRGAKPLGPTRWQRSDASYASANMPEHQSADSCTGAYRTFWLAADSALSRAGPGPRLPQLRAGVACSHIWRMRLLAEDVERRCCGNPIGLSRMWFPSRWPCGL